MLKPFPWQVAALEKFKDKDSAAFFMEMRLGKSLTAILWATARCKAHGINDPKILVLTPKSPAAGWCDELSKNGLQYIHAEGTLVKRAKLVGVASWTIMIYGSFINTIEAQDYNWDAVILDESTVIKSPKAKITKLILSKLNPKIKAILTGYPTPQAEVECFTQMAWAYNEWLGFNNYWTWRNAWQFPSGFGWKFRPGKLDRLRENLQKDSYLITRKEAGVGSVKLYSKRTAEMDSVAKALVKEVETTWAVPGIETKTSLEVIGWIRRITGGHLPGKIIPCWKYDYLMEMLLTEFKDQQIVVWFAYSAELVRVWRLLKLQGFACEFIQGKTSTKKRAYRIKKFNSKESKIILINVACGRFGLDLSSANTAVYFSNSFSVESRKQSEDRIISVQKNEPVQIVDLVTLNSSDEDVLELYKTRQNAYTYMLKATKKRADAYTA